MKSIFAHLTQSLQNYFVVNLENEADEEKINAFSYKKNSYLKDDSGISKETKLKKMTV